MRKVGKQSFMFDSVYIKETSTSASRLEKNGPIGSYFDKCFSDNYCEKKSWEKAEMALLKSAIDNLLIKSNIKEDDVELFVGGDLNNQIVINNYCLKSYPFTSIGIYSACATLTEGLIVASSFVDNTKTKNVIVATSSHNSTSERQFRNPTEYGGQKSETTTFTATGAGCCLLTNEKTKIKVTKATVGRITDSLQLDSTDMGRVMAPAAAHTLMMHLSDFNLKIDEYDLIVTGDLSKYGKMMFLEILNSYNIDIKNYEDSGLLIYDIKTQPVFSGGSGAGCIALVSMGYLYKEMLKGKYKKILLIATGALLNPIMTFQKETIPAIAHAVALERVE